VTYRREREIIHTLQHVALRSGWHDVTWKSDRTVFTPLAQIILAAAVVIGSAGIAIMFIDAVLRH
jgi:hypothetical protein